MIDEHDDRRELDDDLEAIIPAIRTMCALETRELIELLGWRLAMIPIELRMVRDERKAGMQ